MRKQEIVLGIDPGTKKIGFGLIEKKDKNYSFISAGLIKPEKMTLPEIAKEFVKIIKKHRPKLLAIEKVYFGRNTSSALAVSELKGAFLSQAETAKLRVIEISPTEVKNIVCGYGRADKLSVRKMMEKIISINKDLNSKDAIDALAIALAGEIKSSGLDNLKISDK
ncbi:MAG: crossover junction endodeoxyribonuclease RuvC [Patescibacteria group bacterium]